MGTTKARGSKTGKVYDVADVLNEARYAEMSQESLADTSDGTLVVAVRRQEAPHFRRLGSSPYRIAVQRRENNPMHNQTVSDLTAAFRAKTTVFQTRTFDESGPAGVKILLGPADAGEYEWWSDDAGNRIPVGDGRYIQPDICGRSTQKDGFWATIGQPSLLVEVIQTHPPEAETLFHLLNLTERNHILVLYFVAPERRSTQFSYTLVTAQGVHVTTAFYFISRQLFANGEAKVRIPEAPRALDEFVQWYAHFRSHFLDDIMKRKNEPPRPPGTASSDSPAAR